MRMTTTADFRSLTFAWGTQTSSDSRLGRGRLRWQPRHIVLEYSVLTGWGIEQHHAFHWFWLEVLIWVDGFGLWRSFCYRCNVWKKVMYAIENRCNTPGKPPRVKESSSRITMWFIQPVSWTTMAVRLIRTATGTYERLCLSLNYTSRFSGTLHLDIQYHREPVA